MTPRERIEAAVDEYRNAVSGHWDEPWLPPPTCVLARARLMAEVDALLLRAECAELRYEKRVEIDKELDRHAIDPMAHSAAMEVVEAARLAPAQIWRGMAPAGHLSPEEVVRAKIQKALSRLDALGKK